MGKTHFERGRNHGAAMVVALKAREFRTFEALRDQVDGDEFTRGVVDALACLSVPVVDSFSADG